MRISIQCAAQRKKKSYPERDEENVEKTETAEYQKNCVNNGPTSTVDVYRASMATQKVSLVGSAGGPRSHNNDNEINGNVPTPHKYNEQKHSGRSIIIIWTNLLLVQALRLGQAKPGQPGIMIDDDAWAWPLASQREVLCWCVCVCARERERGTDAVSAA